ncbi:hypothetical protein [Microvirga sp. KLBC 81]|uniref:hypothetical protein n=1 Tax=Microvirga sp. KLBC 81 TaxID=1862707 RepID=UPI001403DB7F|nr:hypothetical protein [Microvirga sp. KLBC 81]
MDDRVNAAFTDKTISLIDPYEWFLPEMHSSSSGLIGIHNLGELYQEPGPLAVADVDLKIQRVGFSFSWELLAAENPRC